ncbi:hypothetical protein N836_26005 [Leptolyngbya sp. Heron Island J]|uniref:hypothetical protein n=1 Tax=Leptolyngbya sp. Heron Island J TaxID=1385935 RepID=UPI0003B944CA|nr:hypothetical protein [Leptolyngbya sp. Heron Island J]ESA32463.1 hypothetical protein N836_26005 [Leptolyngbya sp. Heron Island J]
MKENHHQTTQLIGGIVEVANRQRLTDLQEALVTQEQALTDALQEIQKVHEFVGTPEKILGNHLTKHGEIAEQVEVGIRNARDLIEQKPPTATFETVGRTAPADYLIDGVEVQSKFINGATKNLDHVLKHMNKYQNFGRDGSYYHIPQDHYDVIEKILKGESGDGLAAKTVRKIQGQIQEVEQTTGRPFTTVVKPGVSSYAEVQQGKIHGTLEKHEDAIRDRDADQRSAIEIEHQASINEMAQVAFKGAAIGAGLKVTFKLIEKVREGKNPFKGDFRIKDWQDIGISAAQGSAMGSVSGASIYAMTSFANLSAPLAGAILSAGYSVASLANSYRKGEIDLDEFLDLGQLACAESAMVAVGAAIGQSTIPMPVIGAVVGTIASRLVIDFGKKYLTNESDQLEVWMTQYQAQWTKRIDAAYHAVLQQITAEFEKLGNLMVSAFDESKNTALRLQASIDLARVFGVVEGSIIHNTDELDEFMLA